MNQVINTASLPCDNTRTTKVTQAAIADDMLKMSGCICLHKRHQWQLITFEGLEHLLISL